MDKITELMNRLSELTPDELSELKTSIVTEFDTLDSQEDRTRESVEQMSALADAHDQVAGEETNRVAEAEELSQLANDASNRIKGDSEEDEDTVEEKVEEDEENLQTFSTDTKDSDEDKDEDKDDEEKKEFSAETVSEVEAPAETVEDVPSELSEEVAEEAELSAETPEEAELSEAPAEEATLSAEEVTSEESAPETTLSSLEEPNQESEETAVTSSINTDIQAPDENAPAVEETAPFKATIVAAADVRGFVGGDVMPNKKALAQALINRRQAMGRTFGGDGEQALVASIKYEDIYSSERTLDSSDTEGNRDKVDAVVASLKLPGAVTAAGGLYGPVDTSWDIYELGETLGRPVKESLPSFNADRGGLRFTTPPVLKDLEGAVSVWTLQDDIAAAGEGGPTKPSIRVEAGEEVTVYLEAQPLILTFGNIGARAYPELVERHINLAMVWQARFAESRLLNRIGALSTAVTAAGELGAARDILVQVDTAAAAMRNRHRLDEKAPLKAIFPLWFKNALRSDLVKQLPGDGQDAALSLADATISRWFSERDINVTWTLDGGEDGQILGEQAAGVLNDFPANVVWYLFPEGTFLFLEDATIDLGLVRDSTLNATNDYQMFVETFENVAKVGVESLKITSELKIAGASAGTVNTLV